MTTTKNIQELQHQLKLDKDESLPDRAAVEEVLRKIDRKQSRLSRKLNAATEDKKKKILLKLDVLARQKSRGEQLLALIETKS